MFVFSSSFLVPCLELKETEKQYLHESGVKATSSSNSSLLWQNLPSDEEGPDNILLEPVIVKVHVVSAGVQLGRVCGMVHYVMVW